MAAPVASSSFAAAPSIPPPPPPRAIFDISENGLKLVDLNSKWSYHFIQPHLLAEAVTVRVSSGSPWPHNQDAAMLGDSVMKSMCLLTWKERGHSRDEWKERFSSGVSKNSYLASMAAEHGVEDLLHFGGPRAERPLRVFSEEQLAGGVEALIGAVYEDCGPDKGPANELAFRLGVWYPRNGAEDFAFDRMMGAWKPLWRW